MDEKQAIVEAWKQTVATQMHFNEMGMKLRGLALTLLAAILTAESLVKPPGGWLAVCAALISWAAFYLLDRWYYYYLLIGAVLHGEALELRAKELGLVLPGAPDSRDSMLGLTYRISKLNQEGWKTLGKYKLDMYYVVIALAVLVLLVLRWRGR
ncbi:MAG: hypothetical protein FJ245_15380 [Nitrospira sp.]|nr:hypothetical protein [Nitrospira sp.]